MLTELRLRNQSQQLYVRALSAAWRRSTQVFNPSLWLLKDPEAEEKMLRDADIAHAIGLRRAMIAGKDWTLVPRSKNHERAEMALHVGTELVGCLKKFTESRRLLARAFFSGQRYARIHGEHRKLKIGDGRERVWYVPTRLEDVDMRMYRQVVDSDGSTGDPPSGHWERWDVYRGDWEPETIAESRQTIRHTYEDDQATLGHGRALREALGYWWYAKTHILQESLQAAERFGQGVLRARVDGARDADTDLPNTEVIREWVEALEDMRSRHVLVHDAKDDVDMVQMSGTGWQMFRELREELRNTISTLVLGATMNTTATQGGSYALAEVHENTTEALIQYDRQSLEETLTDDLIIGCLWHRNHANLRELGIENQAPRFTITQEKALDPQIRVQVAATAVQMGLPLAKADVYEQIGFRAPEDGEDVVEPQQPAPGGMPGGGGFPFKFRRGGEVAEASPWTFAGDWDEQKHPRDGGKFAPAEGRTNSGQEPDEDRTDSGRIPDGPTANAPLPDGVTDQASALARADVELASLPQDARDYIDGKTPMDRQDVTPAEKKQADAAVGDLGDAIAGAADAPDGTVGAVLRESMEDTADPSVKKINGQAMLKLAVGLGIMPAAAAWNVAKSYAGLVGTVLNLPGAVKGAAGAIRTVWAQRGQGSWSDMASSMAGKAREAASAAAKSIRDNPVTGSLDVIGTSLIAIPFPFSMDAGLAVKGIAKAGKAFNPAQTEQSIRESIRKAFLRKRRRDRMGRFASVQPTLFDQ